jgi:hypothetical protein
MRNTFDVGVTIVAVILLVGVVAVMNFNTISALAQTMMPGDQTSNSTTMAGNTTGNMSKANSTSAVPTPVGPPGP